MNMKKFDFAISNPPYQETSKSLNTDNTAVTNVFHKFQELGIAIATSTSMIYPGGRWLQGSGKGVKGFGKKTLTSKTLKSIDYFDYKTTSNNVFPGTEIKDGVSIVNIDNTVDNHGSINYNGNVVSLPESGILILDTELISIVEKLSSFPKVKDSVQPRTLFSIESDFVEKNPDKVILVNRDNEDNDSDHVFTPISMSSPVKLYTNDRSGPAGRVQWYWVERDEIKTGHHMLNKWKVVTGSGIQGHEKTLNFECVGENSAVGRSRIVVSSFDTEKEMLNAQKYFNTVFAQRLFISSIMGRLSEFGAFVPDLIDYTDTNPDINWNEPLESQLYRLFKLTDEGIAVIDEQSD